MGSICKGSIGLLCVANRPIKGHVITSLGMQGRATRRQVQRHGQIVVIQFDQFGRVFGLIQGIRDNHGYRFADVANMAIAQQRAFGVRSWAAIAIFDHNRGQISGNTRSHQIIIGQHRQHTIGITRIADIQRGDGGVGHGRAQEIGHRRPIGGDIIDKLSCARQKSLIFDPADRLAFAKGFHCMPHPLLNHTLETIYRLSSPITNFTRFVQFQTLQHNPRSAP